MCLKRGFTLIELLVVIAIIGVLASVVLVSLNGARNSSREAAVKAQMKEIAKSAELYLAINSSYHGTDTSGGRDDDLGSCTGAAFTDGFFLDPNVIEMVTQVRSNTLQITGNMSRVFCAIGGSTVADSWAFAAPLEDNGTNDRGWCVDSSGFAGEVIFSMSDSGPASAPLGGLTAVAQCP